MTNEIKYEPITKKIGKQNIKPQGGWIVLCAYCGEQVGNTQKYCTICKKKSGREEILKQNVEVLKDLRKKGYCKEEILLQRP